VQHRDKYSSVTELASAEEEGVAYRIVDIARLSPVAIIAPHGGKIEPRTSEIARAIAGDDFSLYLFEGLLADDNYTRLHVTSHNFDEPRCVALISECDTVVAIHGCDNSHHAVLLGGRDDNLKRSVAQALSSASIANLVSGHPFQGRGRDNICNRGRTRQGVQVELPRKFRASSSVEAFVTAVRAVLFEKHRAA